MRVAGNIGLQKSQAQQAFNNIVSQMVMNRYGGGWGTPEQKWVRAVACDMARAPGWARVCNNAVCQVHCPEAAALLRIELGIQAARLS